MDQQRELPTPVRMPKELKSWLKSQAERNHRSLTGEVVYRLEQSRKQDAGEVKTPA